MADFEAKLCEEVQKYPHLFDSSLKEHKDVVRISNSWREIATSLHRDVDHCKRRWRYIREQFVKSKRHEERRGDGRKAKSYKHADLLVWLTPFVKHRSTESNVFCAMSDTVNSNDDSETEKEVASQSSSLCISSPIISAVSSDGAQGSTKKRKRNADSVEEGILKSFENDESLNFGRTVADSIRKMPRRMQVLVKKRINDVIFEAEIQLCDGPCADYAVADGSCADVRVKEETPEFAETC